jgi:predicted dehydrogenase
MATRTNRREFIKRSALAGTGFWIAGRGAWAEETSGKSPNEKLNFASVGIGNKGYGDCNQVANHGNMVALCDVDQNVLHLRQSQYPKAKAYTDYRKMFDEMGKSIDAITIATPDHQHAIIAMTAMKMGKHVYCQKPLTHDVAEARELRMAARQYKVATQMGNQGTSDGGFRKGVEVLRSGILGPISEVHVWTNRAGDLWPQSPAIRELPKPAKPPASLKWDLWLGTAPERPYATKYYHPMNWRGWWDFGGGALGDMGCHTTNMAFMGLQLEYPTAVRAESEKPNEWTYPAWAKIEYDFPQRGDQPPVKVTWYEGQKDGKQFRPPEELMHKVRTQFATSQHKGVASTQPVPDLATSGAIIIGEKGMMYSPDDYGGFWALLPYESFADFKASPQILPRLESPVTDMDERHKVEWIKAIKGGPAALSNFDYAGLLSEFILLGNVAVRESGTKLEWDGPNMKFPNAPQAEKWLKRQYRAGWEA